MRRLRDSQYVIGGEVSGIAMKAMSDKDDQSVKDDYEGRMRERRGLLQRLVATSQHFIYSRGAALVGSQLWWCP